MTVNKLHIIHFIIHILNSNGKVNVLIKTNEILKFREWNGIYLIISRLKIPKASLQIWNKNLVDFGI